MKCCNNCVNLGHNGFCDLKDKVISIDALDIIYCKDFEEIKEDEQKVVIKRCSTCKYFGMRCYDIVRRCDDNYSKWTPKEDLKSCQNCKHLINQKYCPILFGCTQHNKWTSKVDVPNLNKIEKLNEDYKRKGLMKNYMWNKINEIIEKLNKE